MVLMLFCFFRLHLETLGKCFVASFLDSKKLIYYFVLHRFCGTALGKPRHYPVEVRDRQVMSNELREQIAKKKNGNFFISVFAIRFQDRWNFVRFLCRPHCYYGHYRG